MFQGVPVPGRPKARLLAAALAGFGARGYAAVGVGELAAAAGVTTGALYHHFGSKLGLYDAVRVDVERRALDRMEGAAAARPGDVPAVLLVGFDYLAGAGFARLLAEAHPDRAADPIEAFLGTLAGPAPAGRILHAAWRAALDSAAGGTSPDAVRTALRSCLAG